MSVDDETNKTYSNLELSDRDGVNLERDYETKSMSMDEKVTSTDSVMTPKEGQDFNYMFLIDYSHYESRIKKCESLIERNNENVESLNRRLEKLRKKEGDVSAWSKVERFLREILACCDNDD